MIVLRSWLDHRVQPVAALVALAGVGIGLAAGQSPRLVVFGAVGLLLVAMVLQDLTVGVAIFTLATFFQVTPSGGGLALSKPLGLVIMASWLIELARDWNAVPMLWRDRPGLFALLVAFCAWAALSMLWADDVAEARASVVRLGLVVVFFLVIYSAVRTTQDLRLIGWAFATGTALTTLYGFAFGIYVENRFTGGMADANFLASVLVASLAISGFFLAVEETRALRLLLIGYIVLFAVALVLTQSRGGIVAIAVTSLAACFFAGSFRSRAFVAASLIVVVGVGFYALFAPAAIRDRATSISSSSSAGRSDAWRIAVRIAEDSPLTGVGLNNYPIVQATYITDSIDLVSVSVFRSSRLAAHNTFLQMLSELGVIGIGLFAALIVTSLRTALSAIATVRRRSSEAVMRGLVVGIVGLLSAYVFLSGTYEKQLWLMLGLSAVIPSVVARERRSAAQQRESHRPQEREEVVAP